MSLPDYVFLIDVDNTLLDTDRIVDDLRAQLIQSLGGLQAAQYWARFEAMREATGYVDYLGALQACRAAPQASEPEDARWLQVADFLLDYPFEDRVYPDVFRLLLQIRAIGPTVILSDGDLVLLNACAPADLSVAHIGDLLGRDLGRWPAPAEAVSLGRHASGVL